MKSICLFIAAVSLAASAALAAEVEGAAPEVRPEGRVGEGAGATITKSGAVANTGVRTEIAPNAVGATNIVGNMLHRPTSQAAQEVAGGTCGQGSDLEKSLDVSGRRKIANAVKAGLAGDRCVSQGAASIYSEIAEADQAMTTRLNEVEHKASASDLDVDGKAREVITFATVVKSHLGDDETIDASVSRAEQTCDNHCDFIGPALCDIAVMKRAHTMAQSL